MSRVNEDDLDWSETTHDETAFRRKKLAAAAGTERLGASLYELPPGKSSWPYHFHTGNEEAAYVLAGEATLRTPDGEETVEAGDFLSFRADPEGAHSLRNDGDEPFRYLMVSTMRDPDVTVYPDSEKIGVYAGAAPGGESERTVSGYFRRDDAVDYWTDES